MENAVSSSGSRWDANSPWRSGTIGALRKLHLHIDTWYVLHFIASYTQFGARHPGSNNPLTTCNDDPDGGHYG